VLRLGASELWIEGDALDIVHAIQNSTRAQGYVGNLLGDIHEKYKVTHIPRENNGPADFMTVGASKALRSITI